MKRSMVVLSFLTGVGAASLQMGLSSSGLAQTSETVKGADQADPSVKEEPPPGGCMPIGVTASGEIVFPFLCKGFIEGHKAANQQPAAADESKQRPVAAEEPRPTSTEQHEDTNQKPVATEESVQKPVAAEEQPPTSDAITGSTEKSSAKKSEDRKSEDKSSSKQPEGVPPQTSRSAPEPVETDRPPRAEHRRREGRRSHEGRSGPPGCTYFQTYNPRSETYTDYSGRRRACRY
jgi:hypothetical protein